MPRKRKVTGDNYNKPFPTRLRDLMKTTNTTQQTLADVLKFEARQSIGAYMDGTSSPDINNFVKICTYFGVSADWLLGLSDVKTPNADLKAVRLYTGLSEKTLFNLNTIGKRADEKIRSYTDEAGDYAGYAALEELREIEAINFFLSQNKGIDLIKNVYDYIITDYRKMIAPLSYLQKKQIEYLKTTSYDEALDNDAEYLALIHDANLGVTDYNTMSRLIAKSTLRTNPKILEECDFWEIITKIAEWHKESIDDMEASNGEPTE